MAHRVGAEITVDPGMFYGREDTWFSIPVDYGRITLWLCVSREDPMGTLRIREGDNAEYVKLLGGQARLPGNSGLCVGAQLDWEWGRFVLWTDTEA